MGAKGRGEAVRHAHVRENDAHLRVNPRGKSAADAHMRASGRGKGNSPRAVVTARSP